MRQAILDFPKQFAFEPKVENPRGAKHYDRYIIAGMGGSALPGALLAQENLDIPIMAHRNYGFPHLTDKELEKTLVIAISYSGNTEETLDAFQTALDRGIDVCAISVGGKLIAQAQQRGVPYIQLPDAGILPRMALGFIMMALLVALGRKDILKSLCQLASTLHADEYEDAGRRLAEQLLRRVPIIYASEHNAAIAYIWKIIFNETSKIPAFCNVLPEVNHNEMEGFDVHESTKHLSDNFVCILIKDGEDNPRIIRRMEILAKLYQKRGIETHEIEMEGATRLFKIFSSIVLANWASFYIAESYGIDPESVPMVEEFKRIIV